MKKSKKVVIGMSGGVDSAVSAYLLKEKGYDVVGVTMQIWETDYDGGCCGLSAIDDARKVADMLGIEHYVLNFRDDFKKHVVDNFVAEYKIGRTPNPCIACNRYIKWQSLLTKSLQLGADYIATGHYAKIATANNRFAIQRSDAGAKDQSYALFNLTQEQLKHTLFPLGEYSKDKIREIANTLKLEVANKPDSQEICFIPDNNYGNYLEQYLDTQEGNFIDINGEKIGKHKGIIYYTIGQRKNLGMTFGKPMYVKKILPEANDVMLADDKDIFDDHLTAEDVNFMYKELITGSMRVFAKIRYSHTPAPATISFENGVLHCVFDSPQRAVTPGQAAVFYDADGNIICGGTIK